MHGFFSALMQHGFLQMAVAAALLASIGCGVMGTYVVVKRIAFLAGGIAHSVLGGMGAALYFGFEPLHGALPAAVGAALLIGWVRLHWRAQEDTLISALWAIGMAIGGDRCAPVESCEQQSTTPTELNSLNCLRLLPSLFIDYHIDSYY